MSDEDATRGSQFGHGDAACGASHGRSLGLGFLIFDLRDLGLSQGQGCLLDPTKGGALWEENLASLSTFPCFREVEGNQGPKPAFPPAERATHPVNSDCTCPFHNVSSGCPTTSQEKPDRIMKLS